MSISYRFLPNVLTLSILSVFHTANAATPTEVANDLPVTVVTASRALETINIVPASISVITNAQLSQSAVDELPNLLRQDPALSVVSLGGYGAILPTVRADWLQIGCLLAARGEQGEWQVGLVRRLQYDAERQTHVGIEILSARLMAVRVKLEGHPHERDNGEEYAVLFGATLAGASTCTLLMRTSSFLVGRQYRVTELESHYLVEPLQRVEHGDDFEIVEFNVLCSLND